MKAALSVTAGSRPTENRLLAELPEAAYQRLWPHLEFVPLPAGRTLAEPGEPVTHAYFPTSGIVSLLTPLESGTTTGVALVGHEGMIGTSVILQGARARGPLWRTVVQCAGDAYRVRSDVLLREFQVGGDLQQLMLRFTQALIAQIAQTVVCSRQHLLAERLCTWLLHLVDRLPDNDIAVTQYSLSELLGVRRETITEAARHLQCAGWIEYRRGHVHVTDRLALVQQACECYGAVRQEYARLAPAPTGRKLGTAGHRDPLSKVTGG